MANTSRRSYPTTSDETNITSNSLANSTRQSYKRPRYSYGSRYRQKTKSSYPFLGFENENLKPTLRGSLHLDDRFFLYGIQPGNIIEFKGPEKSGKTYLLTYFIARLLLVYPEKKVLFVDTRHKFCIKNLISIICHFDKELQNLIGNTHEERQKMLSKPLFVLFEKYPVMLKYLDRIQVFQCYSPEDLMLLFEPSDESVVQKLLLQDSNVSLVAVDAIDNYSYSESMQTSSWAHQWPNIMHSLKNSVSSTRCPVICTTLIPAENYVYTIKQKSLQRQSKELTEETKGPSQASNHLSNEAKTFSQNPATVSASGSAKTRKQKLPVERKCVSNFLIDYSVFTNILELNNVSKAEKLKVMSSYEKNVTHCAAAYLRSRHNANTAGSGGNHRVKFSIFSDMIWILK